MSHQYYPNSYRASLSAPSYLSSSRLSGMSSSSPSSRYGSGQAQVQIYAGAAIVQTVSYPQQTNQRHPNRLSVPLQTFNQPNISPVSFTGGRPVSYPNTPGGRSNRSSRSSSPKSYSPPILFYDKNAPHYSFTNFSPHPIKYKGKSYPTSEHLFQSLKVCFPLCLRHLLTISSSNTDLASRNTFEHVLGPLA